MQQLSDNMKKFIQLERKKDEVKKFYEELKIVTEAVSKEVGIGGMFQDPADMTVFKIVIPEGKFVTFDKISYIRTRRSHEPRGDLSEKAAEAAGFAVPERK